MSVKISRRKEARDTSLRDFMLAALLPLLLSGFFGYFLGTANLADASVTGGDLEELRRQVDTLSTIATERQKLMGRLETLYSSLVEARGKHKKEFDQIKQQHLVALPSDNSLDHWVMEYNRTSREYLTRLGEIEGEAKGEKYLSDQEVDAILAPFRLLNKINKEYFNLQVTTYSIQLNDKGHLLETIDQQQEETDDKVREVRNELEETRLQVQRKDVEIIRLQKQLAEGTSGSWEGPEPVSYAAEVTAINGAVSQIRTTCRDLPSGVFVSRNRKEDIENAISDQLRTIEQQTAKIN